MELDMVADMVVDKVVDKVANMVADMLADNKKMVADMEVDKAADKLVDMFKTKCITPAKPKLFDAKCTRLACLLSFASLFQDNS